MLSGRSLVCSNRTASGCADQARNEVDTTRTCVLNRFRGFSELLLYIKFAIYSVGNRGILIFRDSWHLSQFHLLPFAFYVGAFDSHRTHCCTLYKSTQDNLKKPENPSLVANETGREVTVVSIQAQQVLPPCYQVAQPNCRLGMLTPLFLVASFKRDLTSKFSNGCCVLTYTVLSWQFQKEGWREDTISMSASRVKEAQLICISLRTASVD